MLPLPPAGRAGRPHKKVEEARGQGHRRTCAVPGRALASPNSAARRPSSGKRPAPGLESKHSPALRAAPVHALKARPTT